MAKQTQKKGKSVILAQQGAGAAPPAEEAAHPSGEPHGGTIAGRMPTALGVDDSATGSPGADADREQAEERAHQQRGKSGAAG